MPNRPIPRQKPQDPTLIRALCKIGDSISQQAEALGLKRQQLSAIIAGTRPLSAELAAEIGKRSGYSLRALRPDLFERRGGNPWPRPNKASKHGIEGVG